jgi:hypothetical protein
VSLKKKVHYENWDSPSREPGPTFGHAGEKLYREDAGTRREQSIAANAVSIPMTRLLQRRRGETLDIVNEKMD